jgi:hypothetical protein
MNKTENLKYILSRFDHYIDSVHSKSNLYIVLNTFIIGGCITMLSSINSNKLNTLLIYILFLIILLSISSVIIILTALKPHLETKTSKSILFFNDVSKTGLYEYIDKVKHINDDEFETDFIEQIHCLSIGLTVKYKKLKWVSYFLIFQFLTILTWTLIFITQNN